MIQFGSSVTWIAKLSEQILGINLGYVGVCMSISFSLIIQIFSNKEMLFVYPTSELLGKECRAMNKCTLVILPFNVDFAYMDK